MGLTWSILCDEYEELLPAFDAVEF
jgi:hypothetical protein